MIKDYFDMADHEFDNTKTHDFRKCPALGYWKWVRHLDTIWPNGHLIFGTAFHEGAALWNTGGILSNLGLDRDQLYIDACQRMADELEEMPDMPGNKTLQSAETLLKAVIDHPDLQGKSTAVEQRYEKQLYYDHGSKKNVIYFGKVDLRLVKENIDYVADYKTKGRLQKNFFDSFMLDNQPRGYCWLTGTRNFIVVVLHTIKGKCSYDGQQGPCVHIQDYRYHDHEIERWRQEAEATIRQIYTNIMRVRADDTPHYEIFPRYATQCQPPNFGCTYQRLCEQECDGKHAGIDYSVYKEI